MAENKDRFRVGVLQLPTSADVKENNVLEVGRELERFLGGAKGDEVPDLVLLPEVWNSPYMASEFPKHSEKVPGVGAQFDSSLKSSSFYPIALTAQQYGVTVVAGSI